MSREKFLETIKNETEREIITRFIDFTGLWIGQEIPTQETFVDSIHSVPPQPYKVFIVAEYKDRTEKTIRKDIDQFFFSGSTCLRRSNMCKKVFAGTKLDFLSLVSLHSALNPFASDEYRRAEVIDFISKEYYNSSL